MPRHPRSGWQRMWPHNALRDRNLLPHSLHGWVSFGAAGSGSFVYFRLESVGSIFDLFFLGVILQMLGFAFFGPAEAADVDVVHSIWQGKGAGEGEKNLKSFRGRLLSGLLDREKGEPIKSKVVVTNR